MDAAQIRIIAIGGGGCTNGADPGIDEWIIGLFGRNRPRVGFIGTASGDSPEKRAGFEAAYGQAGEIAEALAPTATVEQCASWLRNLDLVYIGGGNTSVLLETWRRSTWDGALVAAVRNGLTVVGVSAGAVCWFETAFSDADGQGFRGLPGLGLLEGSCCPHYSAEPARRPAFEAAVRQGDVHGGIAIDDGVAVLCDASGAVGWFSARPEAAAYTVSRVAGRAACERLPALSSV